MKVCRICKNQTIKELLDLGMQPICNRFLADQKEKQAQFPMVIEQCGKCGAIQLAEPVKAQELMPRHTWITYNEPESHLNKLAEVISKLPGLSQDSLITGISFKDDSTLTLLKNSGFKKTKRLDPQNDLAITENHIGVETIQDRLSVLKADLFVKKYGKSDVVIARHILEHAHDLSGFLDAIKRLVTDQGYIVIEVPDCKDAFEKLDYTTLWEEHSVYFTPGTFQACFMFCGFSVVYSQSFPYPFENSLVIIAKPAKQQQDYNVPVNKLKEELSRAGNYAGKFRQQRDKSKEYLRNYREKHGKIALIGAGHLACTFVNLFDLKDCIEFVADDNQNKLGLFMAGSRLPIYKTDLLVKKHIKLCLIGVNPQNDSNIIKKNHGFIASGGSFASIFPKSSLALKLDS